MKTGITTASLSLRAETEYSFDIIKQTGADCCEVALRTFYEYRPEFSEKFSARTNGLDVCSVRVAPNNFELQLFDESRRVRGDGFYWLDQVMRSAQLFGAKNYTFNGGLIYSGESVNFDRTAERLREIADFCAGYGVTICLENARRSVCDRPEIFSGLKSRCPQIAAALNIGRAAELCYPCQMFIENMSGSISHVFVSDVDESGRACLPGLGVYDFSEIFKRLKGTGFDGAVLIDTPNFRDIDELKNSVEFLKTIADKA